MTEAGWERCTDREQMLEFLADRISERKFRLFAVACCRRQWELFPKIPHRRVIEAAEGFADGVGTREELLALAEPFSRLYLRPSLTREQGRLASAAHGLVMSPGYDPLWRQALRVAESVSDALAARLGDYRGGEFSPASDRDEIEQITLLHDIVGHPFYPEGVGPAWLTSTVVQLARGMYESRDYAAMPILADALQDAGCDNDIILGHCHAPWPHVRGCWVVDLVLGKA